eukprot:770560-Pleurochrysis_carterae.AAC.1
MADCKGTPGTTSPHRLVVTCAEDEKSGRGAGPKGVFAERPFERGWSIGVRAFGRAGGGTAAGAEADPELSSRTADGCAGRDDSEEKFELRSEANTRAIRKLKSGGYAACALEFHVFPCLDPPAMAACSECWQRRCVKD